MHWRPPRTVSRQSLPRSASGRLLHSPLDQPAIPLPEKEAAMSQHQANIFKSMKDVRCEATISHQCGITMNDSVEARFIAEVMADKEGITVTYMPAMIRIDGNGKILFDMAEISEALGRVMTPHLFEISTSTHYGRMVMVDDNTVVLFGDMNDALAYE